MDMSNENHVPGRKSYKRPLASASVKPKATKDLQNEVSRPSWNLSSRPVAAPVEMRSKDPRQDNSFQSRSSGSRPSVPAAAKPKAFKELHVSPAAMKGLLVTKRRSAPNVQPRKQQFPSEEKFIQGDKSSRSVSKKIPKSSSPKVLASKPDSAESDGKPRSSGSDEERGRILGARRSLERALEKADSLVDQLEKLEDDIEALEEEKHLTPIQMVERTRARINSDIWHWFVDHQETSSKRWRWLSDSRSMKKDEQPVIPYKFGLLLHFASQGDVEAVTRLLDEGLDANQSDYDGRTAMHLAASEGHVGVIQLLLKRGAQVNPVDRWGDTMVPPTYADGKHQCNISEPLANAMRYNYTQVCQIPVAHQGIIYNNPWTPDFEIDSDELKLETGTPIGRDEAGHLKVADFGLSKLFQEGYVRYSMTERQAHVLRVVQASKPHEVALDRGKAAAGPMIFAKHYPPKMKGLIRRCWDGNPNARPRFSDIIDTFEDIQKRSFWTTMPIYYAVTNFHSNWHRCIQHNNRSTLSFTMKEGTVLEVAFVVGQQFSWVPMVQLCLN